MKDVETFECIRSKLRDRRIVANKMTTTTTFDQLYRQDLLQVVDRFADRNNVELNGSKVAFFSNKIDRPCVGKVPKMVGGHEVETVGFIQRHSKKTKNLKQIFGSIFFRLHFMCR